MEQEIGPGDIIVGHNKLGVHCICLVERILEEKLYSVCWTYGDSIKPHRETISHGSVCAIIKRPGWKHYKVLH